MKAWAEGRMDSKANVEHASAGALLLAFLAGSSYGVGGPVSQIAAEHGFQIAQICFAQFLSAFIILGLLVVCRFRPSMTWHDMARLVLLGLVSSISSFSYYVAIRLLSVSTAVAMQFQYVWMAVVIQALVEHSAPGKWKVISSALIIFGTLFGSGMMDEMLAGNLSMDPLGLACALVCAIFYALFIYLNGRIAVDYHPVARTFFEVAGGLMLAVLVVPFFGGFDFDVVAIAPWGLLMGMLMSIIPVLFIIVASSSASGSLVAILTSSELPVAVLAGYLLLGQGVSPLAIFGVVVILGAICLAQLDQKGDVE